MKIYFIYRCLYGEDFIQQSILSVKDYADKILVFWTDTPFGNISEVIYKGITQPIPKPIDRILDRINELELPNLMTYYAHFPDPMNQVTVLINDYVLPNYEKPDLIIFLEPDMVWRKDQLELALKFIPDQISYVKQVELWKTPQFRIPERAKRPGAIFYNMKNLSQVPPTGRDGCPAPVSRVPAIPTLIHNFGFCVSERNMLWKHMLALGFAKLIGDRVPNEDWYEKKWLSWDFETNNKNLEISRGREHWIPCAVPYTDELPETITWTK